MFRIIKELRPTWVVGENVANFANMELDRTLFDLESAGYKGQSFIIPACAVDAKHRRDRTFVVAYSDSFGRHNRQNNREERQFHNQLIGNATEEDRQRNRRINILGRYVQFFPTPQSRDYRSGDKPNSKRAQRKTEQGWSLNLNDSVMYTPRTKGMCGGTGSFQTMCELQEKGVISEQERKQMTAGNAGQLNPTWVEWLMGFPIGWTELKD